MYNNVSDKDVAIQRIQYLEKMLKEAHTKLLQRSYEHGEMCLITGKPSHMCLSTFDNLDRICRDCLTAVERIDA